MSQPILALSGPAGALQDDQVLVDALPYLDKDYNETDRQLALRLIEQECKVFRPTKNYLKHLPPPDYDAFLSPVMIKEFARIAKKQEMPKLDVSRCELPCPAGTSRGGDKLAWRKAIRNAKAQNEHLVLRQLNLEMMEEYSPEIYLRKNKELEELLAEGQNELERLKSQVMEVHARRKMSQESAGRELKELEGHWVQMVTNNYSMELATNQLNDFVSSSAKRLKLDPSFFESKH